MEVSLFPVSLNGQSYGTYYVYYFMETDTFVFLFYTYMCISTYMYQESTPVPAQNQGSILDIPLPLFIDFFFHTGKSGSHYLQHVYLFVNASTQLK